jgi:hypothetical protein
MRRFSRFSQVFFLALALIGFFALTGCGGGGGGGGSSAVTSSTPSTSGDVSVSGAISDSATAASIRQAIRTAAVSGATITCRYYDDNGTNQTLATQTTTNANGEYTINGLPRGLTNVIIEANNNGTPFSVVVPALPETGEVATSAVAPVMNPDTGKQTQLVDAAIGLGLKPKDVNMGEVFAVLPPDAVAKLSQDDLKKIAQQIKEKEQARKDAVNKLNIDPTILDNLKKEARKIAQEIQEKIAQGDTTYLNTDWATLFNQKLEEVAKTLNLPPDSWMALRQIDTESFAGNIQKEFENKAEIKEQIQNLGKGLETRKFKDVFTGIIEALKDLKDDAGLSDADIAEVAKMFEQMGTDLAMASDKANYLGSHPSAAVMASIMKKIFKALGLFEGTTPLIAQLGPKPGDAAAQGIWEPPAAGQAPGAPPTSEQMLAFQEFVRNTIINNIKNNPALMAKLGSNDVKIRALFFLLFGPKEVGFDPSTMGDTSAGNSTGASSGTFSANNSEIMGIIKKLAAAQVINGQQYEYSIEPPANHPAAPSDWNGLLGLLRPDSSITLSESASSDVKDSFIVRVEMEAIPASGQAPAFKVLSVQKNQFTGTAGQFEFKRIMRFFGLLIQKGDDFYLTDPTDPNGERPFFKLTLTGELLTKAAGLVNQILAGEGEAAPVTQGLTYAVLTVKTLEKSEKVFVGTGTGQQPTVPTTTPTTPTTPTAPTATGTIPLPPTTGTSTTPIPPTTPTTTELIQVKGKLYSTDGDNTLVQAQQRDGSTWTAVGDVKLIPGKTQASAFAQFNEKAVVVVGSFVTIDGAQKFRVDTIVDDVTNTFQKPTFVGFLSQPGSIMELSDVKELQNNNYVTYSQPLINIRGANDKATAALQALLGKKVLLSGTWTTEDGVEILLVTSAVRIG